MIQSVSQAEIDRWVRENELRIVPKRPPKPTRWKGREPKPWFKPVFAAWIWMKERLGEAVKLIIACGIGVALGLMFVWAW